jgi:hypothetical protein
MRINVDDVVGWAMAFTMVSLGALIWGWLAFLYFYGIKCG